MVSFEINQKSKIKNQSEKKKCIISPPLQKEKKKKKKNLSRPAEEKKKGRYCKTKRKQEHLPPASTTFKQLSQTELIQQRR
jgi:hypothetical protein